MIVLSWVIIRGVDDRRTAWSTDELVPTASNV
jgi:hypothetical protein